MSKVDSWMPVYVADYLADTTHLSTAEHGAYMLLLMHAWRNGGKLPADQERLRTITKMQPAAWRKSWPVLKEFFNESDGTFTQKRLSKELTKAANMTAQRSEAGKASAEKRWGNETDNGKVTGVITESVTLPPRENAPSPSSLQTSLPSSLPSPDSLPSQPQVQKASARKRAAPIKTALPEGFTISNRVRQWAEVKGFSQLDAHLENFIRQVRARGNTYADWDEGFMGAIAKDWAGIRNGKGNDSSAAVAEAKRRIFGNEKDVTDESKRL